MLKRRVISVPRCQDPHLVQHSSRVLVPWDFTECDESDILSLHRLEATTTHPPSWRDARHTAIATRCHPPLYLSFVAPSSPVPFVCVFHALRLVTDATRVVHRLLRFLPSLIPPVFAISIDTNPPNPIVSGLGTIKSHHCGANISACKRRAQGRERVDMRSRNSNATSAHL